jgi:CDP-diacylglycerol--glycerol-3-phosphate 3-phosphatidyltransferase
MVVARILIAIALFLDALNGAISSWFMPAFILAVALDVADGMTARRLNVASMQLRRADSFADAFLIYSVAIAAWLVYGDLIQPFISVIILMVILQIAAVAIAAIKYRSLPAYHTWSFRFSGFLMFLAAMQLFILQSAGILMLIAFVIASLSCLENIAITLILPKPTSDVPGVWYAISLRKELYIHPDS